MDLLAFAAAGFATATIGTIAGLGGAALLVPVLVLAGIEPARAVPLGLLVVAAGSLSAAGAQIDEGWVNHRLGVSLESLAAAGAAAGAFLSGVLSADVLRIVLAGAALIAAAATATRRHGGEMPSDDPKQDPPVSTPGELPRTLGGVYRERGALRTYRARRFPSSLAAMAGIGLLAGVSGTSGGFLKTPLMTRLMGVPTKVAAATTTFTLGITAASALVVVGLRGQIQPVDGAAVVAGALAGGLAGGYLHSRLDARIVAVGLAFALTAIAAVLVVTL